MSKFFKENAKAFLFFVPIIVCIVFILALTYDNWSLYLPQNKAKAIDRAEKYITETYGKTFVKTDVIMYSNAFDAEDLQSYNYSGAAVKVIFKDEDGNKADIIVDGKYSVIYDDYTYSLLYQTVNKELNDNISKMKFDKIKNVDVYYRYGEPDPDHAVKLYNSTEEPEELVKGFPKISIYDIGIQTALNNDSPKEDIETAAVQIYKVLVYLQSIGFIDDDGVWTNYKILPVLDYANIPEEEAVRSIIEVIG